MEDTINVGGNVPGHSATACRFTFPRLLLA